MPNNKRPEVELVRSAANGLWLEILARAGMPADHLDGRHHPCPKCGGTDRFRAFGDCAATGGVFCNQCFDHKNGDGFATLQWWLGIEFPAAVRHVNEHLGNPAGTHAVNGKPAKSRINPAKHLLFAEPAWNDELASLWCRHKRPATAAALEACGARIARYRDAWPVMVLPVRGKAAIGNVAALPAGYAIQSLCGATLPVYRRNVAVGKFSTQWKKVKLTAGSDAGWIGQVDRLASATHVWKVEGLSDLLALISQRLPVGHIVLTNAFGAKENPTSPSSSWLAESLADKIVYVLHDCDRPGQDGAMGYLRDDGRQRIGWCQAIAAHAKECRNVRLPYPVVADHGPDLRNWLNSDGTVEKLLDLAGQAGQVTPADTDIDIRESIDDPDRLARSNLAQLRKQGRDLRYWRDEWYVWKGPLYRKITNQEFRAKLHGAVRHQFEQDYQLACERWKNGRGDDEDSDEPPKIKKVTQTLVSNVMSATGSQAVVSSSVEPMTWLPDRSRRNYISMSNGLLDLDALLADSDDYLLPHSPDWFSTVALPYDFEPESRCPKWSKFLQYNLEGDQERMDILQEWAGYLLLPDTGQQKFLLMEGEGSNGKSVYLAGITAMLGEENVSNVSLETFGDRFSRTETIHKLANIAGDCEELDKVAEGYIKSFTSGDRMFFDRKGISGINCVPTARMMVSCNERPKFRDRSKGIWRRMLLIPWRVEVPDSMKVRNMDKPAWWQASGELPGMFWWALQGLHRLREKGFTTSTISDIAKTEYQTETNSARAFLQEFVEPAQGEIIRGTWLYKLYVAWANEGGYKPFGSRVFGKEVRRIFPEADRVQRRERAFNGSRPRHWCHLHMRFSNEAIAGIDTSDETQLSSAETRDE